MQKNKLQGGKRKWQRGNEPPAILVKRPVRGNSVLPNFFGESYSGRLDSEHASSNLSWKTSVFLPAMASAQGVDLTPRSPGLSPAPRELLLTKEGSMPQAHGWNFHLGFPGVRLWGEAGLVVGGRMPFQRVSAILLGFLDIQNGCQVESSGRSRDGLNWDLLSGSLW